MTAWTIPGRSGQDRARTRWAAALMSGRGHGLGGGVEDMAPSVQLRPPTPPDPPGSWTVRLVARSGPRASVGSGQAGSEQRAREPAGAASGPPSGHANGPASVRSAQGHHERPRVGRHRGPRTPRTPVRWRRPPPHPAPRRDGQEAGTPPPTLSPSGRGVTAQAPAPVRPVVATVMTVPTSELHEPGDADPPAGHEEVKLLPASVTAMKPHSFRFISISTSVHH